MRRGRSGVVLSAITFLFVAIGPAPWASAENLVFRVVMVEDENEDPAAAGKAAARALLKAMGDTALKAVLVSECFEDREYKEAMLNGVCSILPPDVVMGGATYGSFTQKGCTDFDAVCLLGFGGKGLSVSSQLVENLGTAKLTVDTDEAAITRKLHAAGQRLAKQLHRSDRDRLLVLIGDAHSPKNQFLVEGVQQVLGTQFPITGGCVNKNAGQTFVYYRGQTYQDSALALMLAGDFQVSLSGRQANENKAVIRTAKEGAIEAKSKVKGVPFAVLAFNCAGRRSKLNDYDEELAAIQSALGSDLPLFGCYCAGEMGPVDAPRKETDPFCGGAGWHVMFTILSQ